MGYGKGMTVCVLPKKEDAECVLFFYVETVATSLVSLRSLRAA